jgi:hypothetical protein
LYVVGLVEDEPIEEGACVVEAAPNSGVALEGGQQQVIASCVDLLEHFVRLANGLVVVKDHTE